MKKLTAEELANCVERVQNQLQYSMDNDESNKSLSQIEDHIAAIEAELAGYKEHRTDADKAYADYLTFGQGGATFGEAQLLSKLRVQEERAEKAEAGLERIRSAQQTEEGFGNWFQCVAAHTLDPSFPDPGPFVKRNQATERAILVYLKTERAIERLNEATALLQDLSWESGKGGQCSFCTALKEDGHDDDCRIVVFLKGAQ